MFVFIVKIVTFVSTKQSKTKSPHEVGSQAGAKNSKDSTFKLQTFTKMKNLINNPKPTIVEIVSNTEIAFVANNKAYTLEITQEVLDYVFDTTVVAYATDYDYTVDTHYEEEPCVSLFDWKKHPLNSQQLQAVVENSQDFWYDITDCSDLGDALKKELARRSVLSYITTTANRARSVFGSMKIAMCHAWTRAKIIATGVVNFIKVADYDLENPPIQHRRVATLSAFGIAPKNEQKVATTTHKFIDLEKYEAFVNQGLDKIQAAAKSVISFHDWQVVSWN